jgi:hypothetical protein
MQNFNAALGATYTIEFSTENQTWNVIEDNIVDGDETIYRSWRITLFCIL